MPEQKGTHSTLTEVPRLSLGLVALLQYLSSPGLPNFDNEHRIGETTAKT